MSAESRLATTMEIARFAFRASDGGFRAKYSTHEVRAHNGVVNITPIHHEDAKVLKGNVLSLRTSDVRRGTDPVSMSLRDSRVDTSTGRLALDRTGFIEEIENFEEGIEQSWRFTSAPTGVGPMTVSVALSGHPFVGETQQGLHFITPGKLGFRYGNATWIDANGVATSIKSRWENNRISITVPEEVLESSTYPAVLDPTVNPEVAVDVPVVGWTGTASLRSAIGSSGAGFLVVWADGRNNSQDIFATRLSSDGTVLDNLGIAISQDTTTKDNPTVAFIGGEYVVAWDNGTTIGAARVTTAGAVIALASLGAGTQPTLASRGTDGLLVYSSGVDVRAAVYNGGSFGSPFGITGGVTAVTPSVGADPAGEFLVTWSEGATAANLRGRFVTAGGSLAAAFDISAGAGGQNQADTAFNGTDFVTVWSNNKNGVDIFGTRVSPTGVVLDTHMEDTIVVGGRILSEAAGTQNQPALACNAGTCVATWTDRRTFATNVTDVFALLIDANLVPIGSDIAIASLPDEQRSPAVVGDGTNFRIAWHDRRHHSADTVFSAALNTDGSLPDGSGSNVVTGNNRQVDPAMTASPTNWLAVWSDSRSLGNDIMGVRFNGASSKLDTAALTISNASGQQGRPSVTFDGTNFLTVWNDTRNGAEEDIFAGRTTTTGGPLDGTGVAISTAAGDQRRPSVASGTGSVSLIVWQDGRATPGIYAALVDTTSAINVTVNDIQVCTGTGVTHSDPAVAFDPVNNVFLVTWNDDRSGNDDIFGARVDLSGTVLDSCGVPISSAADAQTQSKVTFGAGQFFVTWTDKSVDPAGDIYGARVSVGSGVSVVPAGGTALASGAAAQSDSDVAFVTPNIFSVAFVQGGDIHGQSVLTTGALDGVNYVITANPEDESAPAIAAGPTGKPAMIAYQKQQPSLGTIRVMTRRIVFETGGASGSACTFDAVCASGFCVDGYCCDQACGGNDTTDCQACSVQRGAAVNGTCAIITNTNHRCRYYADTFCDRIELCDGVNPTCPPDLGRREGVTCNIAGGGTGECPLNSPAGAPHVCQ